jgi:hypothetical protein
MRRLGILMVGLALAAAACGGTPSTGTSTETRPPRTTTTRPPRPTTTVTTAPTTTSATAPTTTTTSTTAPPTTSTTAPPTTTTSTTAPPTTTTTTQGPPRVFLPYVSLAPPPSYPGSEGASGSGCDAGSGALTDGAWFGYVTAADASGITFDLACFYFGSVAETEAAADGTEAPGGFYIRNQNPLTREIAIPTGSPVYSIDASTGNTFIELTFGDWPSGSGGYTPCPGPVCGVWVSITDGFITGIVEQYVP